MSTGLIVGKNLNRFARLAQMGETVFHTGDLANLWQITNKNTLYTTIKRYVERGLLFRIYKGFYAISPPTQFDPFFLGIKALHKYAYISTETILKEEGVIQQIPSYITLISDQTKRFSILGNSYYSRALPDQLLYQSNGIITLASGMRRATLERAVVDLLYFNKHAYFDKANLINWGKVYSLQKTLGYPLTHNYSKYND